MWPSMIVLQILVIAARAHGSLAEAWGAPPSQHPTVQYKAPKHDVDSAHGEAAAKQVGLTAGGMVNQRSLMRKEDAVYHHGRHAHGVKAMFNALDLDHDGLITSAEVKEIAQSKHYHSEALAQLLGGLPEGEESKGTSFVEFSDAVHEAARLGALHHRVQELLEEKSQTVLTQEEQRIVEIHQHHRSGNVSCGGHKAESCKKCPITAADGTETLDHGVEWCNGDCVYHSGECYKIGDEPAGASTHQAGNGSHATTPLPAALNPEKTAAEQEAIDDAAKAAIDEENKEAEEKKEEEKEEEKKKGMTLSKFWLVVIIVVSVILFICCISTLVAVFVFGFNVRPADKEDMEDALADGEAEEEEGEEVEAES